MVMKNAHNIAALDRSSVIHPFTNLGDFDKGKSDPVVVETAHGVRIRTADGKELIDGFAGLYCMNVGYGRSEVAEAISRQAHKLAYYHSYAGHTTDELAILASRIVGMAPNNMQRVFFGLSGSDANETQAKLVWYYNNLRGLPQKKKIISRDRGYHGCSVISGSMTGMSFYHDLMDLPVSLIRHTGAPHHYWGANQGESEGEFSKRRASELDALIELEGPETVGAFIAEPVLGTGGIIPPPQGYWDAIQPILQKHDVLLIADEVITGFGRIGTPFGSHHYGMKPDLITIAKGLTSAYVPMSGAIVGEKVWQVIRDGSAKAGPFSHGYTYSGHPLGAAAANAVLDIVERENLAANAAKVGAHLRSGLTKLLGGHEHVGEIRGEGMLAAIEFVGNRDKKLRFNPSLKVGARVSSAAREEGLIARAMPHGDILGLAPPLVLTEQDADEIIARTVKAVNSVFDKMTSAHEL